ncbi:MAG: hypothetical protein ACYTAF_07795 [Planctomycetota bacterium]|jgi:hypothetical protein
MNRLALAGLLAVIAAGCASGGASKDELQLIEDRLSARIAESAAAVRNELTDAKKKYPDVVAAERKVLNALQDLEKMRGDVTNGMVNMEKLVAAARADMLQILEAEERLLTDRLMSIRAVIERLRKNQPAGKPAPPAEPEEEKPGESEGE